MEATDVMVAWVIYATPDGYMLRRQFKKRRAEDWVSRSIAPMGTYNAGDPLIDHDCMAWHSPSMKALERCVPRHAQNMTNDGEHPSVMAVWLQVDDGHETTEVVTYWVIYRPTPSKPFFVLRRQFQKLRSPQDWVSRRLAPMGTFNAGDPMIDHDCLELHGTLRQVLAAVPQSLIRVMGDEDPSIEGVWLE